VDVGWNLIDKGERWSVEDFLEEYPEGQDVTDWDMLIDDLATALEEILNDAT
jgi:hypothetical protein